MGDSYIEEYNIHPMACTGTGFPVKTSYSLVSDFGSNWYPLFCTVLVRTIQHFNNTGMLPLIQ